MEPEIKEKWLAALRSGKYKQGKSFLRVQDGNHTSFCCLGVLCDISNEGKWIQTQNGVTHYVVNDFLGDQALPDPLRKKFEIDIHTHRELTRRNDGMHGMYRHSFEEIADWIEINI